MRCEGPASGSPISPGSALGCDVARGAPMLEEIDETVEVCHCQFIDCRIEDKKHMVKRDEPWM